MSKGSLSLWNPCLRKLFFYSAHVMFASPSRSQSVAYEKAPRTCGRLVGKIVGCAQARQVQIQVFDGGFGSDAETLATQHATDWRYMCNTAQLYIQQSNNTLSNSHRRRIPVPLLSYQQQNDCANIDMSKPCHFPAFPRPKALDATLPVAHSC